jgi:hypothetical protein
LRADGVTILPDYLLYIPDTKNHLIEVKRVFCLTDEDALTRAAEMVTDRQGAEVWERTRLVGKRPLAI